MINKPFAIETIKVLCKINYVMKQAAGTVVSLVDSFGMSEHKSPESFDLIEV
jgi:hypothetical protein